MSLSGAAAIKIAALYTAFAVIATAANLGSQWLVSRVVSGTFALILAVLVGTGVGLVVKYLLDKRYIFRYRSTGARQNARVFALYVMMSGVTTVIFWAFEFGFELLFRNEVMRYLGAVIGLAIGYTAKYLLDRRYVFIAEDSRQ